MPTFKIDKEGFAIIRSTTIFIVIINLVCFYYFDQIARYIAGFTFLIWLFVVRFFRLPARPLIQDEQKVFSPADGTIVVIERVMEDEYFKDERVQVSVFMSIWNVHANWFGIGGKIKYFKHHNGKFMVAWHPKSSTENERTTVVVEGVYGSVLFKQIAGMVARRIVTYAKVDSSVDQNSRLGFIKFGSRLDILLPLDATINVQMGQKVVGNQTVIATFDNSKS